MNGTPTAAAGVNPEEPGIFQPTGNPKIPFQNIAACPNGTKTVVVNQPGTGGGGFGGGIGFH